MVISKVKSSSKSIVRRCRNVVSRSLRCESLEQRALLAVLLVTSTEPTGPGSISEAVEVANNQDTNPGADVIRFARNVRGTIELTEQLTVTDDLSIEGPGAQALTISGGGVTRIMTLVNSDPATPTRASLRNLTIANGMASDAGPALPGFAFGGGIYNVGGFLVLDNMVFRNNVAAGPLAAGGAVANEFGGTVNVSRSVFNDNLAEGLIVGVGGAIASDIGPTLDGAGTPNAAVLNVAGSNFNNNSASAAVNDPSLVPALAPFSGFAFGGAISALSTDALIVNSRFRNNSVHGGDGAPGLNGGFANGGAIFADDFSPFDSVGEPGRDSFMDILGSSFVGNEAVGGAAGEGVDSVGGGAAGGAVSISISFFDETARIRTSEFRNNAATGGAGETGGLAIGGALSILTGAQVEVSLSQFVHNVARGGDSETGSGGNGIGGAIGLGQLQPSAEFPLLGLLPRATIKLSTFNNNLATGGSGGPDGVGGNGSGGAFGALSGATEISLSTFTRNRAQGGSGRIGGDAMGGSIYNSGAELRLARSIIFANMARGGDGDEVDGTSFGGGVFNDLLNPASAFDVDRITEFATRSNVADEGSNYFGLWL